MMRLKEIECFECKEHKLWRYGSDNCIGKSEDAYRGIEVMEDQDIEWETRISGWVEIDE